MTKGELYKIEKRIDEINNLFDYELDDDIYFNLQQELNHIINTLTISLKKAKIEESGLRIVK